MVGVLEGVGECVMGQTDQTPINLTTPAMREAVRQQIVVHGLRTSHDIATALHLRPALVMRILERFVAVGALHAAYTTEDKDNLAIVGGTLSKRFQDLTIPLW
jgi:hypothetical protein